MMKGRFFRNLALILLAVWFLNWAIRRLGDKVGPAWVFPIVTMSLLLLLVISPLFGALGLAWVYNAWKRGAYDLALRRAERIGPLRLRGSGALAGEILFYAGRYDEAEERFRKFLPKEQSRTMGISLDTFGKILGAAGKFEEAETTLKRSIEVNPNRDGAYSALADLYLQRGIQSGEALDLTGKALDREKQPHSVLWMTSCTYAAMWATRAWALARSARKADADQALARALQEAPQVFKPGLAAVHYRSGEAHRARGEMSEARADFKRAIELDPQGRYGSLARRSMEEPAGSHLG
jgi:tetratricopeptide (TPR) repeat protein